jgi:hypothetical protein
MTVTDFARLLVLKLSRSHAPHGNAVLTASRSVKQQAMPARLDSQAALGNQKT